MTDLNSVVDDVTGTMPEVQEHAVEAEQNESEKFTFTQAKDRYGNAFDPERHRTNEAGEPLYNADGTLKVRRGRKRKADVAAGFQIPSSVKPEAAAVGKQISDCIFAVGQMIGGDEWAPVKNAQYGVDEYAQMVQAWTNYADAKDLTDFPPGVAVTVVMLGYAGPRLFLPKTKTRLQKAKETVYGWYAKYRARKS